MEQVSNKLGWACAHGQTTDERKILHKLSPPELWHDDNMDTILNRYLYVAWNNISPIHPQYDIDIDKTMWAT